MSKQKFKYISLFFFAFGIVLLGFFVRKVGLIHIDEAIRNLGWDILWILAFPITWNLVQSLAWSRVVSFFHHKLSLLSSFLVRLIGASVSQLSPMGILAGEPYRAYAVGKRLPKRVSAASVIIDRTMQALGIALLMTIAIIAALHYLSLPK